jgi:Tol biopolymer transport system component
MAQAFNPSKAEVTGDGVPIAEQVRGYYDPVGDHVSQFSASQTGVLTYISGNSASNLQLTWFDRSGTPRGNVGSPGVMEWPMISPDSNTVAVDLLDTQTGLFDVWLYDVKRGTGSRLTFNSRRNDRPIWSPDGSRILFSSTRDGVRNLYQKPISGGGQDTPVHISELDKWPQGWSPDGKYIVELALGPQNTGDLWVLPMFGDRKASRYSQTGYTPLAAISPNGHWLAYCSDEARQFQIYVQTFPSPGSKYQISKDGGMLPVWSRDGKELFYIGVDGALMASEVKAGAQFDSTVPKPLFKPRFGPDPWFDVASDGRFLVPTPIEEPNKALMSVVVNWPAALKK